MAYILTDGLDNIVTYPYSIGLLRRDNPNTSFPANPSLEVLAEWDVFPVEETEPPTIHVINENLIESSPNLADGVWTQAWIVSPASAGEVVERTAAYAQQASEEATGKLTVTNNFVAEGLELSKKLSPEFEAYREAIRDPSALPGYPAYTEFPVVPVNIFAGPVDLSADFETSLS